MLEAVSTVLRLSVLELVIAVVVVVGLIIATALITARRGTRSLRQRLQALGFQPHMVPTQLNGQTWYRVVIGPYATQEAAAAAQQQMRSKYNSIYSGGGASGPPAAGSSD